LRSICNNPCMKRKSLAVFYTLFLAIPFSFVVLTDPVLANARPQKTIDLQGHRGARGLLPENTVPAFLRARDLGVTTLEMDVVINAGGDVFLSHGPWISAKICSYPDGRKVKKSEVKSLKIYDISDEDISGFDCDSRGHPDFPKQQAMKVSGSSPNRVGRSHQKWSKSSLTGAPDYKKNKSPFPKSPRF